MIILTWITSLFIFSLSQYITSKRVLWYIAVVAYVVWGPLHIPFAWPVMFAIPTTDYDHLVPLLSSSEILLPFLTNVKIRWWYPCYLCLTVIFIFAGLYTAWDKNFYRWNTPLAQNTFYYHSSRGNIYVDQKSFQELSYITSYIRNHTTSS